MKRWTACTAAILAAASAVSADTYSFTNVSNNNATSAAAGVAQLRMDVTDAGSSRVNFRLYWNGPVPMSICDVYFDDEGTNGPGVLATFANSDISGSAGVAFSQGASPGNLPSGGNFQTSTGMSADSDAPVSANGVNAAFPTEYLDLSIALYGTHTFADVIAALNQGYIDAAHRGLRVGLHVQAIGSGYQGAGGSESFVGGTQIVIVPLPPAAVAGLGSFTLVLFAITRARARRMRMSE